MDGWMDGWMDDDDDDNSNGQQFETIFKYVRRFRIQ
jgi:hypothetical protein